MSGIISLDHEIMQLTDTGGVPCVYQTSQCNWIIDSSASGRLLEICPRGNNKMVIIIFFVHDNCLLFML